MKSRALALCWVVALLAAVEVRADPPGASAVRTILADPSSGVRPDVARMYAARDAKPLWSDEDGLRPQASRVVDVLADACARGLRPADYGGEDLRAAMRTLGGGGGTSAPALARLDVMLSDRLARFLYDLHSGRLPPRRALVERDGKPKRLDIALLLPEIARADDPEARIAEVEPSLGVYARLKAALGQLRSLASRGSEPHVPDLRVLRPDARDAGVPALRERLAFLGDLPAQNLATAPGAGERYDPVTVSAVEHFQHRHGLAEDGIVGPRTLAQLRVPIAHRVRQIELSLERLRWIPDDLAARVLIVNIPEFEVHGVRRGARRVDFRSEVVVGAAVRRRRTPVLRAEMTRVVFRPYWNVPRSIARGELLPKERRSPGVLAHEGFELVDPTGVAHAVTRAGLADLAAGRLRLRQNPGPDNALGLVKFIFPNPSHVYLHDTPAKSLFERSRRDFSHGCIRVADPVGLAEFVLGPQGWSRARIEAEMAGPKRQVVRIEDPISVLLFYTTAVVHGDGDVHFLEDIYGLDATLERELDAARHSKPCDASADGAQIGLGSGARL